MAPIGPRQKRETWKKILKVILQRAEAPEMQQESHFFGSNDLICEVVCVGR